MDSAIVVGHMYQLGFDFQAVPGAFRLKKSAGWRIVGGPNNLCSSPRGLQRTDDASGRAVRTQRI